MSGVVWVLWVVCTCEWCCVGVVGDMDEWCGRGWDRVVRSVVSVVGSVLGSVVHRKCVVPLVGGVEWCGGVHVE